MNSPRQDDFRRWHLVFLALFIVGWLVTLGNRVLLDPDESRYAEIPREMVVSGDWITPRLNDLKYFEKPALQYWGTAAAYEIFGINEFASRLWCGLTGLFGVLFAGWAASKLYGRNTGILAACLLGCSIFWVVLGHLNTLDMGLSFFLEVAIFAFLLAQNAQAKSKHERSWMLLAWSAAALAFLSKGVVALVLPALTLIVYSIVEREFSAWKRLHFVAGLALFLLITAPWIIAVSIANPEFAYFFFIHEHVQRFLTDEHQRVEAWWFFIPFLLIGALPWLSLAIASIRQQWQADTSTPLASGFRSRRFLLWWIVSVMLFFSASHSKLPPYILPVMPTLALLTANCVSQWLPQRLQRHLIGLALFWIAVLAYLLFAPLPTKRDASPELMATILHWLEASFAVALLATITATWFSQRKQLLNALLTVSLGTFLGFCVLLLGSDHTRELRSNYDLVQLIKPLHDPNKPFYAVNDYDQSFNFYLDRSVTLVGYRGELDFGLTQEPSKGLPDVAAFSARWQNDPVGTMAVIRRETYDALQAQLPMTEIGRNVHFVAVSKP